MEKSLLDTLGAVATVATPVLLAILGGLGWFLQNKITKSQARQEAQALRILELEDRLREDRITTYNALLAPFFLLFTSDAAFAQDPKYKNKKKNEIAMAQMLSVEYRQIGFKLSLLAGDSVVRAYNTLMQFFYHIEADPRLIDEKTTHWIGLMGTLLLEVRKSMGNETSDLDRWEMIEWFMADAKKFKADSEAAQRK